MSTQAIPQVGEKLDHYQLEELLAVGGMGLVFRAYDAPLERHVAVKVLSPEVAADEQIATQFIHEARAAATLSHPNVVHVYNVGQDRGLLYFAMELVEGDNLDALQREVTQLNIAEAVQLIRQAALGLQHAHRRGIVHGDVKPANLVVTFAGVLKVTDFGLARRTTAKQTNDFGTPEYASPETIEGKPTDHRSDIYALGATLYHLLAGRPPFIGNDNEAVMRQQLRDTPPPVTKFNLKVTPELSRIISRCLEKRPADRYQSYEELVSDLDQYINGQQATPARKNPPARPRFVVAFVIALMISALGFYLWKVAAEKNTPSRPSRPTQAGNSAGTTRIVTQKVIRTPPTITVSAEDEAFAHQTAVSMQSQADVLVKEGKLGAALAAYREWPLQPLHLSTKANAFIEEQRDIIRGLAMETWRGYETHANTLLKEKKFVEAQTVCEQAIQSLSDFPKCVALAQEELTSIRQAQNRHQAALEAERAALEQRRQARLAELRESASKLVITLQWEKAQAELRAAAQKAEPELQPQIQALQRDEIDALIALRASIATRAKTKPGPNMTLLTKTGDVEGQVITLDADRLTLGRVLAHGVISTPVAWDSLPPTSALRFYALAHDPSDATEQYGFAVLLGHFAVNRLTPLDTARRELQGAVQRDPKRQGSVEPFLTRLADLERRLEQEAALRAANQALEDKAAFAWAQVESAMNSKDPEAVIRELTHFVQNHKDTELARQRQVEIDRLQRSLPKDAPIAPFVQVDLGRTSRARLIQTADGEAPQGFDEEVMFVSSAYLRKNGVARHGLPDDGNLIVRLGDQRVPLQIKVGQGNDSILMFNSSGRRNVNIPLRGKSGKYSHMAILFAGAHQSTDFEITGLYNEGLEPSVFNFRIWDWQYQPESGDKNLAVIPLTASNKSRVSMGARLLALDPNRRLDSIRLQLHADSDGVSVAILGIALLPAN